ncbi:MAG: hypothetical protein H6825_13820 [Planctomycetes bacterium]|nr:hypothetical protein [Planctomycetota bacterium]
MSQAGYDHVQRGRLHPLLHAVAGGTLLGGLAFGDQPYAMAALFVAAAGLSAAAFASHRLRVRDDGDALVLSFGPLPFRRKRVPYADIRSVARGRTTLLDGFGVHWLPFRGWTWNIWGFDCVKVETGSATLRIGTDDPDGLAAFLRARSGAAGERV